MSLRMLAILVLALCGATGPALAKPPLEAFTPLPEIHDMTISPDGKRVAWAQKAGEGHAVVERDLETGKTRTITRTNEQQITALSYVTDRFLTFIPYSIEYYAGQRDIFRSGVSIIFDLERNVSYRSDAFGALLSVSGDGKRGYFRGYGTVIELELVTGNVLNNSFGGSHGEEMFAMSRAGALLVTQKIDRQKGENRIFAVTKAGRKEIFSEKGKPAEVFIAGPTADETAIVLSDSRSGATVLRSLSLSNGVLGEPLFGGAEMKMPIRDGTQTVIGGVVAGPYPRHEFFEAALTADMRSVRASLPGQALELMGMSAGGKRLLIRATGGSESGRYVIFDREARKLMSVMPARPSLSRADMGEVVTIEYPARDGRKVSAILTWPAGVPAEQRKMLPMVVMPHDEPDGRSEVSYSWLVQFMANEGYAVLQPNYRGSSGAGVELRAAGYEQFGRAMQHDVTDGVFELVKAGWIDPDRVCIVGQGWGGYMALMGGAITPQRYRCVVSIGGVTDLPDFMKRRAEGDVRYDDYYAKWLRYLGDPIDNLLDQQRYSPVNLARQFEAPVLLLHGDNERLSPDRQSRKMEQALKAANKPVKFILIDRDSEELLYPESRRIVLSEMAVFLAANLTARAKPPPAASPP